MTSDYSASLRLIHDYVDQSTEAGRRWMAYQRLQANGWNVGSSFTHPAPQRQPRPQAEEPRNPLGYI
jgi:hypothetical protein